VYIQFLLAIGVAVFVSALCSLAEAALYSLPLSHVEVMIKKGRLSGPILQKLKKDIPKPIAAILTLNTIANTMGAAIAGASAVALFGEQSLGWFSALFTMLILFLSEIIPKTAGVTYCKQLAPWIAYPLQLLVTVFKPLIWLCMLATKLVRHTTSSVFTSSEEIQAIASLSKISGAIDRQEEQTIINILELKNKTVRKAMTPRTVTFMLPENLTVAQAKKHRDKWNRHSRVPVYAQDTDDIVGIVLRNDVFLHAAEGKLSTRLSELMYSPHFVAETAPLPNVLVEFFEQRQHLFIVVDEYGGVTGIISLEDIIEEIMGEEIMDESDRTRDMRELARFKKMSARQPKGERI
jgi:CBS domain containing-hemolysin-like protein